MPTDDRLDPVQIIARVGGVIPEFSDRERALEVWIHLARKAGWDIAEVPFESEEIGEDVLGLILIEGIQYRIRYGLRVRRMFVDDIKRTTALAYAAWAEPDLESYKL
ncbi:hypothetical protein AB0L00_30260 [Actinoallomurus sp. NPDC052308]|uniref:hypothetical protein n=1 Tax=Actinoallomurus sp. NPDC052308 TaxID=3155530 RepID=UPI00344261B9